MMIMIYRIIGVSVLTLFLLQGCNEYLDLKPNKKLVVPSTMADLQAIMDYPTMNKGPFAIIEMASDDRNLSKSEWEALPEDWRQNYIWNKVGLNDQLIWNEIYQIVYNSNLVISLIDNLPSNVHTKDQGDLVRGSAYYYRGQSFFDLAQVWALPYDPASSSQALGIPLRLDPNFSEISFRAMSETVYQQALSDLHFASALLPVQSNHKTRPSKAAAFSMLSRVYLTMGNYPKALVYADSCLLHHQAYIDFNTLDTLANAPFQNLNAEMILFKTNSSAISRTRGGAVSSELLELYDVDDLRQNLFFGKRTDGGFHFKGDYSGSTSLSFAGLTTGEMILNRAEGHARNGDVAAALADLNELRKHRFKTKTFTPFVATPEMDIIALVLEERRRELCFKGGLRWLDIRRLSRESKYAITPKREWPGEVHELPPGDPRYAFMIPEEVVAISGMPQNQY